MRVALTGAGGRLGRALVTAMAASPALEAIPWSRPDYDLDDPLAAERLVDAERPDLVVHAAAWTDVDGCARDPILAQRRNGDAAAEMARACVVHGVNLVLISTNEVFDGARTDGVGYDRFDDPNPINPYGVGKLAGETAAWQAFAAEGAPKLAIVRTAWLFGPPGDDFPSKILAAAERADAAGEPLRVVADEIGSPTYAPDLAEALVALLEAGVPRAGYEINLKGTKAGFVTSGTLSPVLKKGIGMAYVIPGAKTPGTEIEVIIRKRAVRARVRKTPFYRRKLFEKTV